MMLLGIKAWAEENRFHWKLDECRDAVVRGKYGHLYEHSGTQLGAFLDYPVDSRLSIRAMRSKQRRINLLGFQNKQRADGEGSWLLPSDLSLKTPHFAALLKILGIRKIRKATGRPFQSRAS